MLIDQFTESELAQIKRELKMIQALGKESVNKEIRDKVDKLFDIPAYHTQLIFPTRSVGDAISTIIDFTLDNFVYKNQGKTKRQIGWYRSQQISQTMEPEYKQMIDEIIEIIKKHRKQKTFPLRKPE